MNGFYLKFKILHRENNIIKENCTSTIHLHKYGKNVILNFSAMLLPI
jgi:hypothetical protein